MNIPTRTCSQSLRAGGMEITKSMAAAEILNRRRARRKLIEFIEYTKPTYRPAPHQRRIAECLERVERGELLRLMLSAPPRHWKSELTTVRLPAWYSSRGAVANEAGRRLSRRRLGVLGRQHHGPRGAPAHHRRPNQGP